MRLRVLSILLAAMVVAPVRAQQTSGGGVTATLGQKTMSNSLPVVLPSDQFIADTTATLQSAAVANGNGTTLNVSGLSSVMLTVNCSACAGGTTVNFEGTEDGTNYTSVWAEQFGTSTIAISTTMAGVTVWQFPTGAVQTIRARISAYSAGTITVTGHASSASFHPYVISAPSIGATAAAVPASAMQVGGTNGTNLTVPFIDPCQQGARTRVAVNQAAGAQLITGTAAKQTYICDLDLVTATAQNIALVEGTGATCGTGTAGMAGGATAATGWNFAINAILVKGSGGFWVYKTATVADNVCLLQSGVGQISGSLSYVQF